MDNTIERTIDIDAPLDRVWELVTEPGWWVPDESAAAPDRTPGTITVRESTEHGRFPVEVVELRPKQYAAFRWASQFPGQDLAPGRTTLIEFTIDDLGDQVRVTVVESGFAVLDAPDDVKQSGVSSNSKGWDAELVDLQKRAVSG